MNDNKDVKKSKKGEIRLSSAGLKQAGAKSVATLSRYAAVLFMVLVAGVYGFVVLRINALSNAQPSGSDVAAQSTTTPVPRIDPKTAQQLQNLEDNSVNVQTLFEQARNNPFQ
jgi:hypothetical protein